MRGYQIEEIGKWTLRLTLAVGIAVAVAADNDNAAFFLFCGMLASFYMLD